MARKTQIRQDLIKGLNLTLTCTATEQVGDLVYVSGVDTVAQADASAASTSEVVGYIVSKPSATSCIVSAEPGPVTGATGLTAGDPVYLSETAGDVTAVAPAIAVRVGTALSTTTWIFSSGLGGSGGSNFELTSSDKSQTPSATSGDGSSTGLTLTSNPVGTVHVLINGMQVGLGDGVKTDDCYFSSDGGTTAKAISALAAGDTLYWNGVLSSYDLSATDRVDFNYLITV